MLKNVGGADKIIRIIIGLAIGIAGLVTGSWLGLIGIIPLATAIFGVCPAYLPFGIKTCKTGKLAGK
jgi:hypothetical protein